VTGTTRGRTWGWAVAAALLSIGCDPGEVTVSRPSLTGVSGHVLDVRVVRDGEAVEGADVRHVRVDVRDMVWAEGSTDSAGLARFEDVSGFLWVIAEWEGADGRIWGGGEKIRMPGSGDASLDVPVFPPRRGGVVISEIYMQAPDAWETGAFYYQYSKYIELANNSDRTVHLDGMVLGKAYTLWSLASSWPDVCADNEAVRNDPEGVWSHVHWRIPGSGTEHPLAPGEVALIAVIAADHREIHPTMLDISNAHFEIGLADVADNPAAPNLEWLGPRLFRNSMLLLNRTFWLVADPLEVSELPTYDDPTGVLGGNAPQPLRRIPAESIQDVAFIHWDQTGGYSQSPPWTPCRDPVHPSFDRIPGGFLTGNHLLVSAQRRRVTVDGRSVLLDTNVSAVDFHRAERTPGWLP
jgi:hypothetical protein